jgi:putative transposase
VNWKPVNHQRVYWIMKAPHLLLVRKYCERPEHVDDGKVIVMRSPREFIAAQTATN